METHTFFQAPQEKQKQLPLLLNSISGWTESVLCYSFALMGANKVYFCVTQGSS